MVYAFDSTTIDLCLGLYPWAKFHHQKGAVKMHTLLDLRGSIPVFIDITEGSVHDVNSLDMLPIEPGSYYMMDKGYIDFHRLFTLFHQARAFIVTRAKDNPQCKVISSAKFDKEAGLISDQVVKLTGYKSSKFYPEEFRLVIYEDYATDTVYTFMTNDFDLPALSFWIAICNYLLIAIAKKKLNLAISLYHLLKKWGLLCLKRPLSKYSLTIKLNQ